MTAHALRCRVAVAAFVAALATAACTGADARVTAAGDTAGAAAAVGPDTSHRTRSGYVVDSAIPREELLRRFRRGTRRVATLAGGASSREALVQRVFAELARSDTAALRSLAVTRDEFAWLVFPSSPLALPPYSQRPEVAWLLQEAASEKGLHRLLERGAAGRYAYRAHRCARPADREGKNAVWRGCSVRVERDGRPVELRLFGVIVERDGRFKLIGYDNDL